MQADLILRKFDELSGEDVTFFTVEVKRSGAFHDGIPKILASILDTAIKSGVVTGKKGELVVLPIKTGSLKRMYVLGLGEKTSLDFDTILDAAFHIVEHLRARGRSEVTIWPEILGVGRSSLGDLIQAVEIASFRFEELKSEEKKPSFKRVYITFLTKRDGESIAEDVKRAQITAWAVNYVRMLGDLPANELTPRKLAEFTCENAKRYGLRIHVYGEGHCKALGMGAFLGVASGAREEAKLIVVEHTPRGKFPEIVLVGKAITFDSGGISLKPSQGMESMKYDMLGGAVSLAVVIAASRLGLDIPMAAVVPATENLPGGGALKPGDILRAMNGKTIEIISTDAEGRLILADALSYANRRYRPRAVIDLATLTGAKIVALGTKIAGLFSNNRRLKDEILRSSRRTGEHLWELPLFKPYYENIHSEFADVKNSGGRPAGAINAALFLSKFVDKTPWAHIDIAGNGARNRRKGHIPPGATGFGVRLLLDLFERNPLKTL